MPVEHYGTRDVHWQRAVVNNKGPIPSRSTTGDRGPIPSRQQGPKVGTEVYARPGPFPTPGASGRTPCQPPAPLPRPWCGSRRPRWSRRPGAGRRVDTFSHDSGQRGSALSGQPLCATDGSTRARSGAVLCATEGQKLSKCCFLRKYGSAAASEARRSGVARRFHRCIMPVSRQPATVA